MLSALPVPRALLAATAAFALALAAFALLARGPARPATAAGQAAAPLRPGASTAQQIRVLAAAVAARPRDPRGYVALAEAELQRVRETGDPDLYGRAQQAVRRALALAPRSPEATVAAATLALARHDFAGALRLAERARREAPELNRPLPALVDARLELGRYRDAGRALQLLLDRKPGLPAYARASYWRELHGDLAGAEDAMRLAVSAGGEAPENSAWAQVLLGHVLEERGRTAAARLAYAGALARVPRFPAAEAGLARADAAQGRPEAARRRLAAVVVRLPLPEYLVALGELELVTGRRAAARERFALVRAQERLLAAAGVNTDVELALFEAAHGSPRRSLGLARRAWAQAPSVRAADALGWALTRSGRPAAGLRWADRALRLGWRDRAVLVRAGLAAAGAGRPGLARRRLTAALRGNPRFSPWWAATARKALRAL